ncbi:hypothetical protein EGO51_11345 [Haloarcula hispanica]|uniref:Sulfatase N-terminal domain-containing protein n=1 Tax=Haloarcula hispanica TaxID=51589 RepID=A0A5J5LLX9_HALHI|nr:hypothetical protein [Haloarcula hispanica]KAA9410371.1 hypothetical protein EGO51_11345 [Haloarcula hispanica]
MTKGSIYGSENIYTRDWDLLVILDGCRLDVMEEVVAEEEYPFVDDVKSTVSPSGMSSGWMYETFTDDHLSDVQDTSYVTANPHSEVVLGGDHPVDGDDFKLLDEVWRYAWDEDIGTVTADDVTDRAISSGRKHDFDRMIVHYMQPHFPSLSHPQLGSGINLDEVGDAWSSSIWKQLLRNEIDYDEVWEAYKGNLKVVMESLGTLLENVDAERVLITADHGNAFGERGFYGHGEFPIDEIRVVPSIVTSAVDSQEYKPIDRNYNDTDQSVQEKLSALGYLD